MKIEMDDNTFWLGCWLIVASSLTAIILGCTYMGVGYHKTALQNGYTEQQCYGSGSLWVKKP